MDYWGAKGYVGPHSQIIGGGGGLAPPGPPLPTPMIEALSMPVLSVKSRKRQHSYDFANFEASECMSFTHLG